MNVYSAAESLLTARKNKHPAFNFSLQGISLLHVVFRTREDFRSCFCNAEQQSSGFLFTGSELYREGGDIQQHEGLGKLRSHDNEKQM